MKFLILVSSVLAVATASWEPVHEKYHGPLHYPKIHNGVPVEPAAVQHARMLHLMAVAATSHGYGYDNGNEYNNHHEEINKWNGPLHHPKIYNGVPVEPKEVQLARAEHMKAVSAVGHDGHDYHHEETQKWHGPLHYPKIYKGVPVEPKEVQLARAAHLKAVSANGPHHEVYDYHHHDESPAIGYDGKPLDTFEVAAAKAKHFAAVNEALARSSHGISHHYRKRRGAKSYVQFKQVVDHSVPIYVSSDNNEYRYGAHDAPIETPEVQHARAEHLAAHALLSSSYGNDQHNNYEYYDNQDEEDYENYNQQGQDDYHHQEIPVVGHDGTPLDTPEVQHARAAHLAAHAAANTKYY